MRSQSDQRSFLPFEHGPPRFNVGLAPIDGRNWLLPDDQAAWLGPKNALMNIDPEAVYASMGGSLPAQMEASSLVARAVEQDLDSAEPPLFAASRLVSDDLVVMELREGQWTATALCLCSPTFFSPQHALGQSLFGLHRPVPGGDPILGGRISRVFSQMADHVVLERHNWTVQWGDARFTPDGTPIRQAACQADISQAQAMVYVRFERQTIRRLPQTGGILFTIRIKLTNLAELVENPTHGHWFALAWQEADQNVRAYKQWSAFERHVQAILGKGMYKT
ncbi:heme-dependent oxidative N-demethylase subunit alpha family protein [Candidatus Phycosocius spiralis]|uniref:DUF3445 domain-containing protein n=1 Tax=Candidatus Phycosocius spiralis TaxID=2815099 RepID=A0ABQ4PWZ0_9PROT|nr:heme-dependent oxidative N-demethylase subunit alpha family protein [Candidatus Phycosocius spiralis]GIU67474.1 hypothetical protein PsB1_1628 [Candidatus Phycosocius spiralis]